MNEEDENNVDSLLDNLFIVCHKAIVPKNIIMTSEDESALRICYSRFMKSFGIVSEIANYFNNQNQEKNDEK